MSTIDGQPVIALGLDVGGTKTSLVACDAADRPLLTHTVATDPLDLAGQVIGLTQWAAAELAGSGHRPSAVGVAVPGRVQPIEGTLALAVNLGAPILPLARLVREATGLPCFVEHDARAAASWLLDNPVGGPRYVAYLAVGTGVSAGVIIDGALLRGVGGLAGEVGHTIAQPDGPACTCGLRGCLEAVAAGPAIAREARAALAAGRPSSLPSEATSADVFRAAADGDELAIEIADRAVGHLARAVRALVLGFGVERVVVGGGVAAAGALLSERLCAHVDAERRASPLIEGAFANVVVEVLPPDTQAGARGAAAIALAGIAPTSAQREGVGSS